jgi:outer membrane receptor for ferrienterochelin and colicins
MTDSPIRFAACALLAALPFLAALLVLLPQPALGVGPGTSGAGALPSDTGTVLVRVLVHDGPVEGAELRADPVESAELRTGPMIGRTDSEGEARLRLPEGAARIEIRHPGFVTTTLELRVIAGEIVEVEQMLEPEVVLLEGITVGLTRLNRRLQDEPLRVEVLDREEIEEKLLMTPGNIVMLLNETGGLRVQTTSPSLGASNIRVQGMRGRYTQLLADGLPLYGGQAGSIGLMQIPPVDLGQVEIVKGVASALHGGSALGGVINLISLRPEEAPSAEFLLNATSEAGQDGTAYLSGPLTESWGYSLLATGHRQSARDFDGTGWVDLPSYRRGTLRPRLFRDGDGGGTALLTLGFMTESREGGTRPGSTVPDGGAFVEALDTRRLDGGLSATHPVGEGRSLQLRGSGMLQSHDHTFGPVLESDRHGTLFGEAALTGGSFRHSWIWGVALQHDRYRSETFPDFDYGFTVPALFAEHELRITPEATASLSGRWDHHSEYGSHLSPRLSVLYRPGAWTFRASLGGGYFAPTPHVEEIEAAGLSRLEPPTGLQSERARTGSLDAGRTLGPFEVNATAFASRVTDAVQLVPTGATGEGEPRVRLVNVEGETRTSGAEGLLRFRRNHFSITGSYVYVSATEPEPVGEGRRPVPLTPNHTAGLVAMWEDHDEGLVGIEAYFTGRQPLDDNPFRSEGRPHVHLGILGELRMEGWSVFLNAENLLNVRQTRHDPLLRETRAEDGRWTVDAWGPIEGRVVNGGVRIWIGG